MSKCAVCGIETLGRICSPACDAAPTPPSSPALSEARERLENEIGAMRAALENVYHTAQAMGSREAEEFFNIACEGLNAVPASLDAYESAAHASGLAAGREQAGAEWRKRVEGIETGMLNVWREDAQKVRRWMGNAKSTYDRRTLDLCEAVEKMADLLAALRSPVGG